MCADKFQRKKGVRALIQSKGKVQTSSLTRETGHPLPRSLNRKWTKWVPSRLPDMTQKIWRSETKYLIQNSWGVFDESSVQSVEHDTNSESFTTSLICLYCTECSNMYEFDHETTLISDSTVQTAHGFVQLTNTFALMCSHLSGGEMLSEQTKKPQTERNVWNSATCHMSINLQVLLENSQVSGMHWGIRINKHIVT